VVIWGTYRRCESAVRLGHGIAQRRVMAPAAINGPHAETDALRGAGWRGASNSSLRIHSSSWARKVL